MQAILCMICKTSQGGFVLAAWVLTSCSKERPSMCTCSSSPCSADVRTSITMPDCHTGDSVATITEQPAWNSTCVGNAVQ